MRRAIDPIGARRVEPTHNKYLGVTAMKPLAYLSLLLTSPTTLGTV